MTEFVKSYDFGDPHKVPTIDGQEFPYYVDIQGPLVEAANIGHILWVPILVDAPMPSPPEGRPDGVPLNEGTEIRAYDGRLVGTLKNREETP